MMELIKELNESIVNEELIYNELLDEDTAFGILESEYCGNQLVEKLSRRYGDVDIELIEADKDKCFNIKLQSEKGKVVLPLTEDKTVYVDDEEVEYDSFEEALTLIHEMFKRDGQRATTETFVAESTNLFEVSAQARARAEEREWTGGATKKREELKYGDVFNKKTSMKNNPNIDPKKGDTISGGKDGLLLITKVNDNDKTVQAKPMKANPIKRAMMEPKTFKRGRLKGPHTAKGGRNAWVLSR
jgi:hypothetical protein